VTPEKLTLLAIDDDPDILALITAALGREQDLQVLTAIDPERGIEIVSRHRPEIVLIDLRMPRISGMELLEQVLKTDPTIDVILMTAYYTTESAVEAIKKGACDYLNKPFTPEQLLQRVNGLAADIRQRRRAQSLDDELSESCSFEGIVGRSPLMREAFLRLKRIAPHYRTLLISGATGTGKELAAQAIHRLSPVARGPFVVCNCSAIPEALIESELFGHVRGAFTSATSDKAGLFEAADGGALFLDEIGDMPPVSQPKLLRAIQHLEVQRVGSTVPRKVDIRIICASNRDLREEVEAKRFRDDLFYRISMAEVRMPSLAERPDDVLLLVRHFVRRFAESYGKVIRGATRRAEAALLRHPWTGNVRELENAIGYACMIASSSEIDVWDLPDSFGSKSEGAPAGAAELISLAEMEHVHARRVLDAVGGDKARACDILGVSRATLYRLLAPRQPDNRKA
jgi:DNA-binding NtrC family response regulator